MVTRGKEGKYLEALGAKTKEYQEKLAKLRELKKSAIDSLNALELFELAQDYNQIHRALEVILEYDDYRPSLFLNSFLSTLEKAGDLGYLPAVEQLVALHTNGYLSKSYKSKLPYDFKILKGESPVANSPGKATLYGNIKEILKNNRLGAVEQAKQILALSQTF